MKVVKMLLAVAATATAGHAGGVGGDCASLAITEVRLDQFGPDTQEYFEIAGSPGQSLDDVWYVVIGDREGATLGTQNGGVDLALDLTGHSLGPDGLFLVAKSSFTLATPDLVLAAGDLPDGVNLFENGDNVTHMLVTGFTGSLNQDLDEDDDGTLDAMPWTSVLCSVAIIEVATPSGTDTDYFYSILAVGPDGLFAPAHAYTCADTGEWNIGRFDPSAADTPGEANPDCDVALVINEIRIDQTGLDNDEYFELAGAPGTSLNGIFYIVIGDGAGGSGVIEEVTDLTGQVMPADGFFVVAEATFTLSPDDVDFVGNVNFENGDNVTHLLVEGFTGSDGDDLDTNDDGVLDVMPWAAIIDEVAIIGPDVFPDDNHVYSTITVGPDGAFVPGHVFRCVPDGEWLVGPFDPALGIDSPGQENSSCDTPDACGDRGAGDCFIANGTPGCDDATCCDAVCAMDPVCCDFGWDQDCADLANLICRGGNPCGSPDTGGCFTPHGGSGCNDGDCCSAVCAIDPSCCSTAWDESCVTLALQACELHAVPPLRINEIRIDQAGADNDEYLELKGNPGASLDGLTYLVIGEDAEASPGFIEATVNLDGQSIGPDGLFVVAESSFTLGRADLVASINFENGDNVTHMLVSGFLGASGEDLDRDDNCTLDDMPWTAILDSVNIVGPDAPPADNCVYAAVSVGPEGPFVPGHVYRCETAGQWQIGPFDPAEGVDSPGAENPATCPLPSACPNATCPADLNGDTFVNAADLAILLGAWSIPPGTPGCDGASPCCADLSGDTFVNAADLAQLLGAWSIPPGTPGCQ